MTSEEESVVLVEPTSKYGRVPRRLFHKLDGTINQESPERLVRTFLTEYSQLRYTDKLDFSVVFQMNKRDNFYPFLMEMRGRYNSAVDCYSHSHGSYGEFLQHVSLDRETKTDFTNHVVLGIFLAQLMDTISQAKEKSIDLFPNK